MGGSWAFIGFFNNKDWWMCAYWLHASASPAVSLFADSEWWAISSFFLFSIPHTFSHWTRGLGDKNAALRFKGNSKVVSFVSTLSPLWCLSHLLFLYYLLSNLHTLINTIISTKCCKRKSHPHMSSSPFICSLASIFSLHIIFSCEWVVGACNNRVLA